jgi:aspartyl-tRNA(Asn)/glutamyl-tRNA(Gln) amidotransferase subunit C
MSLTHDEVQKIATLARLPMAEEDIAPTQDDLSSILSFVHKLSQVNTKDVPEMISVVELTLPQRQDVVEATDREQILRNAPEVKFHCFTVPKVIE